MLEANNIIMINGLVDVTQKHTIGVQTLTKVVPVVDIYFSDSFTQICGFLYKWQMK